MRQRKTKRLRMIVEVTCPDWLAPIRARREVRTLINQQTHYGHRGPRPLQEIGEDNFRAISVRPAGNIRNV
jgi:hypothetical protein